ncbi:MAG TPA: lysylphosphatidylglycerol synthase transmembrane domain-containing protein, partial [Acidobacteriota bacterium]|nr:lysylphosphatidylglycerol synthase transmembrane domain-containing protein [Acidobacteriota bacterium]
RNTSWNWILLAASLHIIGLLISAYRWQLLLSAQQVRAPLWDLLRSYLIGGFFNNFLPTRVGGDVYRMVDSGKYSGSLLRPAAVIIVERLTGIYGLLLIGVVAVAFYPRLEEVQRLAVTMVSLVLVGLVMTLLFYGSEAFGNWLRSAIVKLPDRLESIIGRMFESFWYFSRSKKLILYVFLLGLALQANVIVYYFLIAQGLDMPMNLLQAAVLMPLLICVQLIPLTPNGLGVREFTYIYLLGSVGVSEAQAVAFSLWDYILTFFYGIFGGLLYLSKN